MMNMPRMSLWIRPAVAALVAGACLHVATAGDLDPPAGAIQPTMKTQEEIEPRRPLDPRDVPIVINVPGSYYLLGSIQAIGFGEDAITINADNVTLDLMGFVISGTEVGFFDNGIVIAPSAENAAISDGSIIGPAEDGVGGAGARGCRVTDLRVANCGEHGIILGDDATVRGCTVTGCTLTGIFCDAGATVENCVARMNQGGIRTSVGSSIRGCTAADNQTGGILASAGSTVAHCAAENNNTLGISSGFSTTISQCSARNNGSDGINVGEGSTVVSCSVFFNAGSGISLSTGCRVIDSTSTSNGEHGIEARSGSYVSNNLCRENGRLIPEGAGVHCVNNDNRIDGNSVHDNDVGISTAAGGNLIVRNSAAGNGTNWSFTGTNDVGTIQTSPVGAGAWDNFSF